MFLHSFIRQVCHSRKSMYAGWNWFRFACNIIPWFLILNFESGCKFFGFFVKRLQGFEWGPCCTAGIHPVSGTMDPNISTAKVLPRKFNWNTRHPGVWGTELHHWKPAVGLVALLAQFLSILASKQGSALLHIPDRWTTHKGIKLSAGRNLLQRLSLQVLIGEEVEKNAAPWLWKQYALYLKRIKCHCPEMSKPVIPLHSRHVGTVSTCFSLSVRCWEDIVFIQHRNNIVDASVFFNKCN